MRPLHPRARLKPAPTSAQELEAEALAEATFLTLALRGALDGDHAPLGVAEREIEDESFSQLRDRIAAAAATSRELEAGDRT